jgi:hypothetical protein
MQLICFDKPHLAPSELHKGFLNSSTGKPIKKIMRYSFSTPFSQASAKKSLQ